MNQYPPHSGGGNGGGGGKGGEGGGNNTVLGIYFKIDSAFDESERVLQDMLKDLRAVRALCMTGAGGIGTGAGGGSIGTSGGVGGGGKGMPQVERAVRVVERVMEEMRGCKGVKDEIRGMM